MQITLLADVEIAGVNHPAGTVVDVPDSDARFLMDVGACAVDTTVVPLPAEAQPLSFREVAARAAKAAEEG